MVKGVEIPNLFKTIDTNKIKPDKTYKVTIKEVRSISQNSLFWHFVGELQKVLNTDKIEIYKNLIRLANIEPVTSFIKIDEIPTWEKQWCSKGTGYCIEIVKIEDDLAECQFFCGSSIFDTNQMSILIEVVKEECKRQGIDTSSLQVRSLYE